MDPPTLKQFDATDTAIAQTSAVPSANSAALLFAILEGLPFRVFVCDASGRYVLQNRVSVRDFGSLVGRLVTDVPAPREKIEQWMADWRRALGGEIVWNEMQIVLNDEPRTYRYVIAPIGAGDTAYATVGVDIDITEQRRAEQALCETYQKLRERDAELAHLDRLSTMGQMASELAHEMSQPLYAIGNFAEACLALIDRPGELDRGELTRWLTQIGQQARRGGEVLRRITHFVRKGELHQQRLDLNQAMRDVLAMLQFELKRHAVEVRMELANAPLLVEGDALLIEQVLVNLIRNAEEAMEATPPGARVMTVHTFESAEGVGAAISDRGAGLPADQVAHLFDSYFTTKPHGTGLGLPICRSTIQAHQGRIWATSNPGGGATFQFVLPPAQSIQSPSSQPASSA
jgi:two-component system, LuxR family, sensor kinase FixL